MSRYYDTEHFCAQQFNAGHVEVKWRTEDGSVILKVENYDGLVSRWGCIIITYLGEFYLISTGFKV